MRKGERGKEEEQGEEINLLKNYLRYECSACMDIRAPCGWLVPTESQERNWIPSIWSY